MYNSSFFLKCFVFLLFVFSCKSKNSNETKYINYQDKIENGYYRKVSPNGFYSIFYKFSNIEKSPVKGLTYFIIRNSDNKKIKEEEGLAAEDIYWKDNDSIAIIPYREVEQAVLSIGDIKTNNELIIKIK